MGAFRDVVIWVPIASSWITRVLQAQVEESQVTVLGDELEDQVNLQIFKRLSSYYLARPNTHLCKAMLSLESLILEGSHGEKIVAECSWVGLIVGRWTQVLWRNG